MFESESSLANFIEEMIFISTSIFVWNVCVSFLKNSYDRLRNYSKIQIDVTILLQIDHCHNKYDIPRPRG
jgi:hypothetical protein